ncbi:MAG: sensor histidine kinase [Sediminibacterium sp.]|nr:sensor histidine kinase [Sediminibacterium sp.]
MSLKSIISFFLFLTISLNAQFDRKRFLDSFYQGTTKEKLVLLSNTPYEDILSIENILKDSIAQLKKIIYAKTESKEPRFLLDIVNINREEFYQNYFGVISICENALKHHTRNLNDSLKILKSIIPAYIKTKNINRVFELNNVIENNRAGIPVDVFNSIQSKKSDLYSLLGLPLVALKYRKLEFKAENTTDLVRFASYNNDIGVFYNHAKLPDSAIIYLTIASKIMDKVLTIYPNNTNHIFFKNLIEGNKASSYEQQGKYMEAIPLLKKDIYYSRLTNNMGSAASSYLAIIDCYLQIPQLHLAKLYLDTAERFISGVDEFDIRVKLCETKSAYYRQKGDLTNALYYLNHYITQKDSISQVEKEKQLLNQQVAFDVYTKEQQLLEKEKIIESGKLEEAKQKTFRAYLISGLLMLIGIVVFLFLNNNLSKKREAELQLKNKHIWRQNKQIETSLKEKELLIQEIHHRVKNNLQIISSMLSLQAGKTDNEEAVVILNDARQRIASMALTHQMLYQKSTLNTVSVKEYVDTLIKQIAGSFELPNIQLNTIIECDNRVIDLDTAIPLGLLINELITNAYKHAFTGRSQGVITVKLWQVKADCFLSIQDNGIGLPVGVEKNSTSLGMELIHILADQLNSTLKIDRENGTSFMIGLFCKS